MAKPKNRRRAEPLEVFPSEHPSRDRSNRFAIDALLRDMGYRIYRRRDGKPTLWVKNSRVFSQDSILEEISRTDAEKLWGAEHMEYLYWEGLPGVVELNSSEDL